jgi:hypothetical protein
MASKNRAGLAVRRWNGLLVGGCGSADIVLAIRTTAARPEFRSLRNADGQRQRRNTHADIRLARAHDLGVVE